jgi:hypothetical protein
VKQTGEYTRVYVLLNRQIHNNLVLLCYCTPDTPQYASSFDHVLDQLEAIHTAIYSHKIIYTTRFSQRKKPQEHHRPIIAVKSGPRTKNKVWKCYGICYGSRVSSGSIVSDYGRSGFDPRQGQRIFPLASVSRPALGPTQPPVQWGPGVLSPGVMRGRGVMLTTHSQLVPRSRMSRSYTSSPPKRLHGV